MSVLITILAVSIFLFYFDPVELISEIGIHNVYIFLFILSVFGGTSSFTSTSFYAAVVILSTTGQLNPLTIGIIAGVGKSIGDSAFYLLGDRAFKAFFDKQPKAIEKVVLWLDDRPKWMIPIFIYIYSGFTPLPGDILMAALAMIEYPYKKAILPMMLGSMTLIMILASGALFGISLV